MKGVIGPKIENLLRIIDQAESVYLEGKIINIKNERVRFELTAFPHRIYGSVYLTATGYNWISGNTITDGLDVVASHSGEISGVDVASIIVRSRHSPIKGKELKALCIEAIFEFFSVNK